MNARSHIHLIEFFNDTQERVDTINCDKESIALVVRWYWLAHDGEEYKIVIDHKLYYTSTVLSMTAKD